MNKKIKLFNSALALGLVFAVLLSFADFNASCDNIRDSVLRIHIIANSDSTEDQQCKMLVRDAVCESAATLLKDCETLEEAEKVVQDSMGTLQSVAEQTVRERGFSYPVSVSLKPTRFNTREYEDFTLPAGEYQALCITLGEGDGQNWWCVMFPSVCVGAASKDSMEDVLNEEETDIVTQKQKFEVRFKIVEIFEEIRNLFIG